MAQPRSPSPTSRPPPPLAPPQVVPENRRRPATFRGICIARRNRGLGSSFKLRNVLDENVAVERSFPLYSPHLTSLKIIERKKARGRGSVRCAVHARRRTFGVSDAFLCVLCDDDSFG